MTKSKRSAPWPQTATYALEKYSLAVEGLATGPGDVRERLRDVFKHIVFIAPEHVPDVEGLREDVGWILAQMTRHPGDRWESSVEITMRRIQRRTGVRIAERIYLVWSKRGWLHRVRRQD